MASHSELQVLKQQLSSRHWFASFIGSLPAEPYHHDNKRTRDQRLRSRQLLMALIRVNNLDVKKFSDRDRFSTITKRFPRLLAFARYDRRHPWRNHRIASMPNRDMVDSLPKEYTTVLLDSKFCE